MYNNINWSIDLTFSTKRKKAPSKFFEKLDDDKRLTIT